MNIIRTVGDLKKALSVYDDSLLLDILYEGEQLSLNNDTQITEVNGAYKNRYLEIRLFEDSNQT